MQQVELVGGEGPWSLRGNTVQPPPSLGAVQHTSCREGIRVTRERWRLQHCILLKGAEIVCGLVGMSGYLLSLGQDEMCKTS